LIALLGVFGQHYNGAVWPNTEKFNTGVREGTLDYTLQRQQPVPVSFAHRHLAGWNLVLGAG
jgi:hypothetical protein